MPFKSQAQRRKFAQLLVEGKISPQTFEEWNRETGRRELPDHVKPRKRSAGRKTTSAKQTWRKKAAGRKTSARKKTTAKGARKTAKK
jgi:hypothetical protein